MITTLQQAIDSIAQDKEFLEKRFGDVLMYLLEHHWDMRSIKQYLNDSALICPHMTMSAEEMSVATNFTVSNYINLDEKSKKFILDAVKKLCNTDGKIGKVSDGYHTFDELYDHRAKLFAVICNQNSACAWKSKLHHDPDEPMYDGMFIVGINTPHGQATYHYDIDPYWDLFHVKELPRAPKWDGHTPSEAISRILTMGEAPTLPQYILHTNEFTKECDKYLTKQWKIPHKEYGLCTEFFIDAFCIDENGLTIPFRFPGATRGTVTLTPKGEVKLIKFYGDTALNPDIGCYEESVLNLVGQYQGKEMPDLLAIFNYHVDGPKFSDKRI